MLILDIAGYHVIKLVVVWHSIKKIVWKETFGTTMIYS